MTVKIFKNTERGDDVPGWSGRVGRATQADKIIQFGENAFALLADTRK